jgi:hypothetical protein
VYAELAPALTPPPPAAGATLLGGFGDALTKQAASLASIRDQAAKYDGPLHLEFGGTVHVLLAAAADLGLRATVAAYREEFDRIFPVTIG